MKRREFLQTAAGLGGLVLLGDWSPVWGETTPVRRLIAIHLQGGNDGLNTIVPSDAVYLRARPKLSLSPSELFPIGSGLSMSKALGPLHELWGQGHLAVVNGVGYDHPNRSHFRSAEIWQTAQTGSVPQDGWLGKTLDVTHRRGVSVDLTLNRSMWCEHSSVVSLDAPDRYRFEDPDPLLVESLDSLYAHGPDLLTRTWQQMRQAMAWLQADPAANGMPATPAGQALTTALQAMPAADIVHVTLTGFDTHSREKERHAKVWTEVSTAVGALWKALQQRRLAESTSILLYSEFGRRVQENASGGTDHGTAGPTFVIGSKVKGGLHGEYPSLTTLDQGDLIHTLDFRQVYAAVLEQWLGTDSQAVLGAHWDAIRLW